MQAVRDGVTELKKTPLHSTHLSLSARMVPFAGWDMPVQYEGVVAEHLAVRSGAGLFDTSHMGELWITGPSPVDAVNRLIGNDLSKMSIGKGVYTCCTNSDAFILDALIVYRLEDSVLVVCNASNIDKIVGHFDAHLDKQHQLRDASPETAMIAVQGPKALDIATEVLGQQNLSALGRFEISYNTATGLGIARTGYTGEDGIEIFCNAADAAPLWEKLMQAGAVPCGLASRDTLRLEACLPLYGNELDEDTTPWEAGLAWTVKMAKDDFLGKSALAAKKELPRKKLVGLEMTSRGIARHGYTVHVDSIESPAIGIVTSGSPAPSLSKNIALAFVPVEKSQIGTSLLVNCRGRVTEAKVVQTPFYKRSQLG